MQKKQSKKLKISDLKYKSKISTKNYYLKKKHEFFFR